MKIENNTSKGITRRETLKTLAAGAYAVPATAVLLTAERAVAQSAPLSTRTITINNNTADPLAITYTPANGNETTENLAAAASTNITAAVGTQLTLDGSAGVLTSQVADVPNVVISYEPFASRTLTINNTTADPLSITYTPANGIETTANLAAGATTNIVAVVGTSLRLDGSSGVQTAQIADAPNVVINY